MDIELRQEYTDEDIRWERNGSIKAIALLMTMGFGFLFIIWLTMTILFSFLESL